MSWTAVTKPTSPTYTGVNPLGKQQYDQADITYDDANVYYDSVNISAYTNIATPSVAWNVSLASLSTSFSVLSQGNSPESVFFKPDGLVMYVLNNGSVTIDQYSLSTAWSIATAAYTQTLSVTVGAPEAIFLRSDGLKLYVLGNTLNKVFEFNLGTAWNITTAVLLQSFSIAAQDTTPRGLFFNHDGTIMYFSGDLTNKVYQYNLSVAWNVATASFNGAKFSIGSQTTTPDGIFFRYDGKKFYLVNAVSSVYGYDVTTPWEVGSLVYQQVKQVSVPTLGVYGIFFKPDGTKMYLTNDTNDSIMEYTMSESYTKVVKPA